MNKKKKKWPIIVAVIAVICVIGAIGGGDSETETKNNEKTTENKKVEKKEKFTLEGEAKGSVDEFGFMKITGTIKNNTDKQASYVQVIFNIYDKDGNQIGTALDNINNLEAGKTWKFEAMSLEQGGETYKLSEITGY